MVKPITTCLVTCRDVRIVLEGLDKYENLFATVYVPASSSAAPATNGSASNGSAPAAAPAAEESLAELLVKAGYAKVGEAFTC
jgi:staphylococcal nuclease domain-containing protein 1